MDAIQNTANNIQLATLRFFQNFKRNNLINYRNLANIFYDKR